MTRITNADQVLILLRAHLERMRAVARTGKAEAAKGKPAPRQGPIERMQELTDTGLSEAQFERALISGLLTEEFGAGLANEPRFQQIIDEVTVAIRRDPDGQNLLRQAIANLRTA